MMDSARDILAIELQHWGWDADTAVRFAGVMASRGILATDATLSGQRYSTETSD